MKHFCAKNVLQMKYIVALPMSKTYKSIYIIIIVVFGMHQYIYQAQSQNMSGQNFFNVMDNLTLNADIVVWYLIMLDQDFYITILERSMK